MILSSISYAVFSGALLSDRYYLATAAAAGLGLIQYLEYADKKARASRRGT